MNASDAEPNRKLLTDQVPALGSQKTSDRFGWIYIFLCNWTFGASYTVEGCPTCPSVHLRVGEVGQMDKLDRVWLSHRVRSQSVTTVAAFLYFAAFRHPLKRLGTEVIIEVSILGDVLRSLSAVSERRADQTSCLASEDSEV